MNPEKSLCPQCRPDRKGLWVRFRHPVSHASLRVDLGHDRQLAKIICDDLNTILGTPTIWENRHHPDFDGLHEQALNSFFGEVERFKERIKAKIDEAELETLKLRINIVDKMVKLIWMTSEVGMKARRQGDFDFAYMIEELDRDEEQVPALKRERPKSTTRGPRREKVK